MECSVAAHQNVQRQEAEQRAGKVTWRERLYRWRQLRRERYALRHLSDDMLKDIGLSREAIQREAHRPFWDDRGWRR
ncbi:MULTISPECIES: DUF1127 domain-containing protein [Halomonadaceae]|uniref:YjiS-like domain-containing protein n=1 Tax=Halomonas campaniensis TaxID=213554 RepID=A0A246RYR0_9GAMM|nr:MULTISPECIES: DUF1127 domain-containing protein [Halomonas]MBS3667185.1 DUF1127 domain-containing protein [Halomonas boliviensis]OWV29216.1 hypothetical protein JI62_16615 [Halomonas campaniensis]